MTARPSESPWCLVLGGGGHARVVVDALAAVGRAGRIAIVDADPDRAGGEVLGYPVIGDDSVLAGAVDDGFTAFVVGVGIGIHGDAAPRRRLFALGRDAGLEPMAVVHPRAAVSAHARIGAGALVAAAAAVNPGAVIGDNAIVNTAAVVEHDGHVGDHAVVGPSAVVLGGAAVGPSALVGAGAVVLPGIAIGDGAIVGAGAVVCSDVAAGARVAGVPARPLTRRDR